MSSNFDFRGLRVQGNDPQTQFMVELQKRLIKNLLKDQTEALESENEDIYSDGYDMETAIKWHSELSSQQVFDYHKSYYPPFEPDGSKVSLYLKCRNLGGTISEYSGFSNNIATFGDPMLVAGPADFDPGIHTYGTKSTALRFNRPTSPYVNTEYVRVSDRTRLQILGMTTGFSIFVRLIVYSLADQGDWSPTIFTKIDDTNATPNDGMLCEVKSDGRLVFIVRDTSVTTAKQTPAGTIVAGQLYDIFLTFTVSGAIQHIYVNGVDQTLTNFVGTVNWQVNVEEHDLYIFRRGRGEESGFLYGDLFIFKYYDELVVSAAQVTNHWLNKQTISPIPYGRVMVANYWATKLATWVTSFTSGSFTGGSFTF